MSRREFVRLPLPERLGFVPTILQPRTLLPNHIEAEAAIADSVLAEGSALSRVQQECILLAIAGARANACCIASRGSVLRSLGVGAEQVALVAGDYRAAALSPAESALLDYSVRLSQRPETVGLHDFDSLRVHGWSDEHLLDAVLTTALARFLCTLAVGLGGRAQPTGAPLARARSRVACSSTTTPVESAGGAPGAPLRTVELGETFPPFVFFREQFGFVPNIFRAQALRPDVIAAEADIIRLVLLNDDVLSRIRKESILLAVSAANLNSYCVTVHCELLRHLGIPEADSERIAIDHHRAGLPESDVALLDFALQLSQRPARYGPPDIRRLKAHGFTDSQALEAVVTTALTDFLNTVQAGLAPEPDFEPRIDPLAGRGLNPRAPAPRPTLRRRESGPAADPDRELVARARDGDLHSFDELMRRHGGRVYRTLMGILTNSADAEDEAQATFLEAFQHLGSFRGRSRFSTWLTRIAINRGLQRIRQTRRVGILSELDDTSGCFDRPGQSQAWVEDAETLYSMEERRRLVEAAIVALPAKYRLVVVLRDLEQLSGEETAHALGIPLATVKTRLLRGRLKLREALAVHFARPYGAARD